MILLKLEAELLELLLLELLLLELEELLLPAWLDPEVELEPVDEEIEVFDEGKFNQDGGYPSWMAARSYAMAASLGVPNEPM